ncbi:MAG: protein phosphatase 2C domain-containing protein [Chthoniobacteraceae bacterium]
MRKNNEDSFLGVQFDAHEVRLLGKIGDASLENADVAFAVSDGMGGAMAGEFASRTTVEKITRLLPRAFKQSAVGIEAGVDDVLDELFTQIHRALLFLGESYEECEGMGVTLSLCWFTPAWMYFAHIGDSRIYYLPASGEMKQLSEDDTFVGWLRRNGKLNEREARDHPRKNILQKALGAGHQFVDPQVGAVGYEKGDTFVLCTDGVIDGLFDSGIVNCIRTPEPADAALNPAQRLVKAALERSGRDNTTAVVVEIV